MKQKILLIICFLMIFLIGACGKKEEEPEAVVVGNGGSRIDIDSLNAPDDDVSTDDKKSTLEIREKSDTIIITVDWDKIIIDDSECSDVEEMKDRIVKSGCTKIDLIHEDASKGMLDEVLGCLGEIEETLEIDVNYN